MLLSVSLAICPLSCSVASHALRLRVYSAPSVCTLRFTPPSHVSAHIAQNCKRVKQIKSKPKSNLLFFKKKRLKEKAKWTLEDLNPWPSGISVSTGIRNATTTPSLLKSLECVCFVFEGGKTHVRMWRLKREMLILFYMVGRERRVNYAEEGGEEARHVRREDCWFER